MLIKTQRSLPVINFRLSIQIHHHSPLRFALLKALLAILLWLCSCTKVGFADTYSPAINRGPFVGDLKFGKNMVAKGHRLWGCEIVGQDLRNSTFDDCDLAGVTFRQCDLRGATFRKAVLFGTLVDGCEWGNNDFTDAVINGIIRQNEAESTGMTADSLLTTWSFKNKNLSKCYVPTDNGKGYDFSHFNLSDACLVDVKKASIISCNLHKTTFSGCDLTKFDFKDANLNSCKIQACQVNYQRLKEKCGFMYGCSFENVEFQGEIDLSESAFGGRKLTGFTTDVARLTNANVSWLTTNLLNAKNVADTQSFRVGNLVNMTINRCDFSGVDFSRQVLVNTQFYECKFDGCNFEDAVITNTAFEDCTGLTRGQFSSTWNSKVGRLEGVVLPK